MKITRRIISCLTIVLSLLLLLGITVVSVSAESAESMPENETAEIPQNWLKDIQIFYEKPLAENNGSELPPPPDPPENIDIDEEDPEEEISSQAESSSAESSSEIIESESSIESSVSEETPHNDDETRSSDTQPLKQRDENDKRDIKSRHVEPAVNSRVLSEAYANSRSTSSNRSKHLLQSVFNTLAEQKEILPLLTDTVMHKNFISVFCHNPFNALAKLCSSIIQSIF